MKGRRKDRMKKISNVISKLAATTAVKMIVGKIERIVKDDPEIIIRYIEEGKTLIDYIPHQKKVFDILRRNPKLIEVFEPDSLVSLLKEAMFETKSWAVAYAYGVIIANPKGKEWLKKNYMELVKKVFGVEFVGVENGTGSKH